MLGDRFLYCRKCSEIHRVTEFDQVPIYTLQGSHVTEQPHDDRLAFLDRHARHTIVQLTAVSETKMPGWRRINPMTARYIEVSDGRDAFVLRGFRKSIQDPITYQLVPKQLKLWDEPRCCAANRLNPPPSEPKSARSTKGSA